MKSLSAQTLVILSNEAHIVTGEGVRQEKGVGGNSGGCVGVCLQSNKV